MAVSWQDLYDLGYYMAQFRRPTLVVYEGDLSDCMIAASATIGSAVIAEGAADVQSAFLDGAKGAKLTVTAADRGVNRQEATNAIGTIKLTNPTIPGALTVPTGFRFATQPDETGSFVTVELTEPLIFTGANQFATADAKVSVSGSAGNVDEDTIVRAIDSLTDLGLSANATITNEEPFVGGEEEQSDPDLREETRGFFLTQRRGTEDALVFAALQVPQVKRASILVDEVAIVTIYVSDQDGNSNQAMVDAVIAKIEGPPAWRAAGDVVYVEGASIFEQAIDITLTARTGVNASVFYDKIRQAVSSAVGRLRPGEILERDIIVNAVRSVDPQRLYFTRIIVNTPSTEIEPDPNQVIRSPIDVITFS